MSDSREQSYYEIALTNRQVMGVFVVLLVCVLAAFLSGVWVGRGGTTGVATVEPEAISSGRSVGEEPLQELDFFGREEQGGAVAEAGEPAAAESTSRASAERPIIIEELGGREPAPSATGVESEAAVPAATPTTQQAATDLTNVLEGEVVIQVFSSREEAQAQRVLDRLRAGGYPAAMSPVDVEGSPMYRVRVGPYSDRGEAQEVADVIRRNYKLDTWITR